MVVVECGGAGVVVLLLLRSEAGRVCIDGGLCVRWLVVGTGDVVVLQWGGRRET